MNGKENYNNHEIIKTLKAVKKYPKMYLRGKVSYLSIETYLNGYLNGLGLFHSVNSGQDIRLWFQEKVGQKSPTSFTVHVENYYKDKTEEERIDILLDLVIEFFQKS